MKKNSLFLIMLFLSASIVVGDNGNDIMKIKAVIEAIQDAQRPSDSIHFEFQEEMTGVNYLLKRGSDIPNHPPFIKNIYNVNLKGLCSRIEQRYQKFVDRESKEVSIEEMHIHVFDGTRQRRLNEPIQSDNVLKGWQYLRNKNQNLINKKVYRSPVDFSDPDIISKYKCELDYDENDEVYTLKFIKESGIYYQYTVAPDKGYNILKMECYTGRGLDYEVNYSLKQYDNELWYPSEISKYRYSGSKKLLENKIEFTNIEFNAEIPEETFKLEFPSGTKVWDGILNDWFYVGGNPEVLLGSDIQQGSVALTNKEISGSSVEHDKKTSTTVGTDNAEILGSDDENDASKAKGKSSIEKRTGGVLWLILIIGVIISATFCFVCKRWKK